MGDENKTVRLTATVSGEMSVDDVPLAPWVNLDALKAGDDDPLEVVVEVPAGKSKRGWNYTPEALKKIVGEVMETGLPAFLGHQKPEDVDTQFPTPVTHWVGAKWENGKAYFRGVVDPSADQLKHWIRGNVIRQVSIFGVPTLKQVGGETQVVDYKPLSIDWTPLNRAGMPTSIVAVGEMDTIGGEIDPQQNGGAQNMDLQELLAALREQLQRRNTTLSAIAGEMGWQFQDVAKELGGDEYQALESKAKAVGEMAQLLGLSEDAKTEDITAAVKKLIDGQKAAMKAQRDQMIDKVVGEMVTAEAARPLIKRMLNVPEDVDEEAVRKAVGEMLAQEDVKQALSGLFREQVPSPLNPGSNAGSGAQNPPAGNGLRTRRVRI